MGSLGQSLHRERLRAQLSQGELAKQLSVSQGTISFWERDIEVPTLDHLLKLLVQFPDLLGAVHEHHEALVQQLRRVERLLFAGKCACENCQCQTHAQPSEESSMRIAVAGKGGSGKTTITGILARTLARLGHKVLAIDADPNPNMAVAMGVPRDDAAQLRVIPRDMAEWRENDLGQAYVHLHKPLDQIADEYGWPVPDGVRLLVTGQITQAGIGCMCQPHAIARGLMAAQREMRWAEVTITDMEAGLEHLSRGTVEHADIMLIVVEPYFRSLDTGGRAADLVKQLGIPRVYLVGNKVRNDAERKAIAELAERKGLGVIATIPYDERLPEADQVGLSPLDFAPESAAVNEVMRLAQALAGSRS